MAPRRGDFRAIIFCMEVVDGRNGSGTGIPSLRGAAFDSKRSGDFARGGGMIGDEVDVAVIHATVGEDQLQIGIIGSHVKVRWSGEFGERLRGSDSPKHSPGPVCWEPEAASGPLPHSSSAIARTSASPEGPSANEGDPSGLISPSTTAPAFTSSRIFLAALSVILSPLASTSSG